MPSNQSYWRDLSVKRIMIASVCVLVCNSTQLFSNNLFQNLVQKLRSKSLSTQNDNDKIDFSIQEIFQNSFEPGPQNFVINSNIRKFNLFPNLFNREASNNKFFPFDSGFSFGSTNNPSDLKIIDGLQSLKEIKRQIDGSSNNLKIKEMGAKNTPLARLLPNNYQDGKSKVVDDLPSPRLISNSVGTINNIELSVDKISMFFTIFGQFLDHDLDLTEAGSSEYLPIPLSKDDRFYNENSKQISFFRSKFIKSSKVRLHPNQVTTWIDGSQIYGSDTKTASQLRLFRKGKLKTSNKGEFLPISKGFFLAGDVRVNQNILLTIFHTVFAREHNRMCDIVSKQNSSQTDEQIYQIARNYVIGLLQKITFQDFLPLLIGRIDYIRKIGPYIRYNQNIDTSIPIEFSTAAFRFGHSLLVSKYDNLDKQGKKIETFELRSIFFNPQLLTTNQNRLAGLIRGLSKTSAKERSPQLIDDVRNFLIANGNQRSQFLDLFSLNIQRGRDHGLPYYNEARKKMGLKPFQSFKEFIKKDKVLVEKLEKLYGSPNKMDLWVGILCEPKVSGAILGELGIQIVSKTFKNLRNGDNFWYERKYPLQIISEIKNTTLSDIIKRNIPNTDILGKNIFLLE